MFSGDFVKLTQTPGANGIHHGGDDDWSDTELLRLLEGVEMYDDDWSEIERHVGTRSAQQCIRKFLELPIEDPYIATEGNMGPLRYARVPFEQADNPVMSVVAFLAGVVGPGVAAEAAKTALHELTDEDAKEAVAEQKATEGSEQVQEATVEQPDEKMDEDTSKDESNQPAAGPSSKPNSPKPPQPEAEDGMVVDGEVSTENPQKPKTTVPHSKVVRAANLALKSSAKAARELADAEDRQIKSTLATLIKLTLTKLELKMAQFEELEELLEEERKGLESARMTLVNERLGLKKMLDTVKGELARQTAGDSTPGTLAAAAGQAQAALVASGARVAEASSTSLEDDMGPVANPSIAPLT